jgi:CrcB protein
MNPLLVINPMSILLVALGGAVGCVLRFMVVNTVSRLNPTVFPLGTMIVNIVGSLLIGVALAVWGREHSARAFIVTGMLGGFTTFSAFSWDMLRLLQHGLYWDALFYASGSVILSLIAVAFGFYLAHSVL